jgi:cell division protein FtsW
MSPSRSRERRASGGEEQVRAHRPDYWLLVIMTILLVIGLVVIYSISPALGAAGGVGGHHFVNRQLLAIGLGIIGFFVASRLPFRLWKQWYKPLLVLAVIATLVAVVLPVNPHYPAHRWIHIGSFSFQTVELVKFALVVWLAKLLSDRMRGKSNGSTKRMLVPLVGLLAAVGLMIAGVQSDLGSTGVIVLMMGVMAYVAGMPMKPLLAVVGVIALIGIIAVAVTPYRRARVATYLNPTQNCSSSGYQECQALISVGSGGFSGIGLGRSVQAYGYLPEAANDSIFAIYAEKFGFIGVLVLLGLFLALFGRMKSVAERAPDNFSRLLVIGILTWLAVQTLINIGAMLALLPLKGITLPFISYGGTSMAVLMTAMGLVFQVSRHTTYAIAEDTATNESRRAGHVDISADRRRVRRAYHPDIGGGRGAEAARPR